MPNSDSNPAPADKTGVCLVVIYNHNYERNIPKINRLYEGKFSHIYHLMPFYQGDDPQVIGVYDSSHQFNNYITQAYDRLTAEPFSHFVFVADDMIIRPDLDENNILDQLKLGRDSAFIPFLKVIDNESFFTWPWALKQVGKLNYDNKASEFRRFLPDLEAARKHLEAHGIDWQRGYTRSVLPFSLRGGVEPLPLELIRSYSRSFLLALRYKFTKTIHALTGRKLGWPEFIARNSQRIAKKQEAPEYPLLWGYADMFVLPASRFKAFCHTSGLFASGRVMVEAAIPTAMAFTIGHIVQNDDIGALDGRMEGEPDEIFARYQGSLSALIQHWRKDVLFYHPIKLSQWKFDL